MCIRTSKHRETEKDPKSKLNRKKTCKNRFWTRLEKNHNQLFLNKKEAGKLRTSSVMLTSGGKLEKIITIIIKYNETLRKSIMKEMDDFTDNGTD